MCQRGHDAPCCEWSENAHWRGVMKGGHSMEHASGVILRVSSTMRAAHLKAVCAAIKIHVHHRRRIGAARRRQRLLPVRQHAVAEFAVRLPPAQTRGKPKRSACWPPPPHADASGTADFTCQQRSVIQLPQLHDQVVELTPSIYAAGTLTWSRHSAAATAPGMLHGQSAGTRTAA